MTSGNALDPVVAADAKDRGSEFTLERVTALCSLKSQKLIYAYKFDSLSSPSWLTEVS